MNPCFYKSILTCGKQTKIAKNYPYGARVGFESETLIQNISVAIILYLSLLCGNNLSKLIIREVYYTHL